MPSLGEVLSAFVGVKPALPTLAEIYAQTAPYSAYPSFLKGADPTGVLDSTPAINAAIAGLPSTGGCLVIPQGTYLVNSALSAIPANCTVMGAGEYTTTINTPLASGTFISMTGANANLYNLAIVNTNASNTAIAVSVNANQLTLQNVSIAGFGSTSGIVTLTSSATFANLFNLYLSSSVANAVGMVVAGADTAIQGCTFNGLSTGMLCNANDRFSVVDVIFKSCALGLSLTNTSATGSTTFGGLQFDACTTGVSIAPGTGQAVQAATFDACVFNAFTTGATLAPTGTGTVTYVDFDGCDFISTVASAIGLNINGAGANSVQYVTCDGVDFVCSGVGAIGFSYTAGGNPAAPISFVNCDFNSTAQSAPLVGSANTLPFLFRSCPGINPVGKLSAQPATSATAVTNNSGCDVMIALVIGATGTTVSVGGQSLGFGAQTSVNQLVRVPYGQTITTSQITGVTWTWFGD